MQAGKGDWSVSEINPLASSLARQDAIAALSTT